MGACCCCRRRTRDDAAPTSPVASSGFQPHPPPATYQQKRVAGGVASVKTSHPGDTVSCGAISDTRSVPSVCLLPNDYTVSSSGALAVNAADLQHQYELHRTSPWTTGLNKTSSPSMFNAIDADGLRVKNSFTDVSSTKDGQSNNS